MLIKENKKKERKKRKIEKKNKEMLIKIKGKCEKRKIKEK